MVKKQDRSYEEKATQIGPRQGFPRGSMDILWYFRTPCSSSSRLVPSPIISAGISKTGISFWYRLTISLASSSCIGGSYLSRYLSTKPEICSTVLRSCGPSSYFFGSPLQWIGRHQVYWKSSLVSKWSTLITQKYSLQSWADSAKPPISLSRVWAGLFAK